MRFGLVGTGYWAREVHGPALAAHEAAELVGVWGRNPERTRETAEALAVSAYDSYAAMLDEVEAVSFAVAPDAQAQFALEAAQAGRHLLLDKPVATFADAAESLRATANEHGVASVVFFTSRFMPAITEWLQSVAVPARWQGGGARWIGAAFAPGSPFDSPWRRERGALWDVGPHALSVLIPALGEVVELTAVGGRDDLVHLVTRHDSGASATVSLALSAPPTAAHVEVTLWGEQGRTQMPKDPSPATVAFARAIDGLVAAAATAGREHPCDLRLGAAITRLLADAEQQLRR